LRAAGSHRFRTLLDLNEAHTTVAGHFESLVVAETRYFDAVLLGSLEDGEVVVDLVGLVIDENLDFLGAEGSVSPEQSSNAIQSAQHQLIICIPKQTPIPNKHPSQTNTCPQYNDQ
jgi:hypothetical protein